MSDLPSLPAAILAQLPTFVADAQQSLRPCPRSEIIGRLGRLLLHFHTAEMPEGYWTALFEDYATDLAAVPADILELAITRWRREGKWWPKIAELLERCEPELGARQTTLRRLKLLRDAKPEEPELPLPTEEEKRRVTELLDRALGRVVRRIPDPQAGAAAHDRVAE